MGGSGGGGGRDGDTQRLGGEAAEGRSGQSLWDRPAAVSGRAFGAVPVGRREAVQLLAGRGGIKLCEK